MSRRKVSKKLSKKLSKKNKKLILAGGGFLLLVLAACYTVFIAPLFQQEKWIYKETTVERGTLTVGVLESGSLEYGVSSMNYELNLDFSDEDDEDDEEEEETVIKYLKVEEVYIAAGERVEEGDAILKFTDDSADSVRKLLQSALVDAQIAYNEAEAEYHLSVLEAGIDYDKLKVNESYASSVYKEEKETINNDISVMQVEIDQRTKNRDSLEEALSEASEDYGEALSDYEKAKATMEQVGTEHIPNYLVYQNEYLNAQAKYESAKKILKQAQQSITENEEKIASLSRSIQTAKARLKIDKLAAEQSYAESRINGENARITYTAKLESLKEELKEAEENKQEIEDQIAAFEAFVGADQILYSDGTGIVTQMEYQAGDTMSEAGVVMSYAAPEGMTISVDVTQEDIVALSVGDAVDIVFHAYEEASYQGTILSIDTTATSGDSATVSYQVVIGVEGDTKKLYGGMTADITFVTEEKEDILYISKKAIVEENGRTYVYRRTALGGMELVLVETGMGNSVNIEILSGLAEGDTIYIASKVSSEAEVEMTE